MNKENGRLLSCILWLILTGLVLLCVVNLCPIVLIAVGISESM